MILLFLLAYIGPHNLQVDSIPINNKYTNHAIQRADTTGTTDSVMYKQVDCSKCKYVVPENKNAIDATTLGIQPGDTVCLHAANIYRTPLKFINFKGTKDEPIIITNCGGSVTVNVEAAYIVKFENSKYFRITGTKNDANNGLKFQGQSTLGLSFDKFTTDFEVDHIEVANVKFAGIMAKTDPSCDDASIRGNFTLQNALIHHNYIHDTGGEGIYVGNSFYSKGVTAACGIRYPHDLENIKIYNNYIQNAGWEAIQLGGAVKGAEVHSNIIEDYGQANVSGQNNGIQIGEGTGGLCYNNYINSGKGNGIIVLGLGDNVIFNNIIIKAGNFGIFCDDRYTPGTGFNFINNTIISPHSDGIRIYADDVKLNSVINNLVINPGSFEEYEHDATKRTGSDSYLFLLNSNVTVKLSNNIFTRDISLVDLSDLSNKDPLACFKRMENPLQTYLKMKKKSTVVDAGKDVSLYGIKFDFDHNPRPRGKGYDIGAIEYAPAK